MFFFGKKKSVNHGCKNRSKNHSNLKQQTNSDHSLEKSTTNTQTQSNTKYSDQLQSYSPITPIVDYSNNNSDIFSDYSLEAISSIANKPSGTTNQENFVTYKSIMIIDVLNKHQQQQQQQHQQKLTSTTNMTKPVNNEFKHREEIDHQNDEDDEASVYINEIKFYNDEVDAIMVKQNSNNSNNKNARVKNEIEKNIDNFYLLTENIQNNQESNNAANMSLNYIFDEKKIASYDITPFRLKNHHMFAAAVNNMIADDEITAVSNLGTKKVIIYNKNFFYFALK